MYGKLLNTIINILFITYLLLLISFYFLHEGIKENVNNINYSTVDTVSTQGVFNVDIYNNLKEKIYSYAGEDCNYELTIKYQQKKSAGVFETSFVKDVINAQNLTFPIRGMGYNADGTAVDEHETEAEYIERCKSIDPKGIITTNDRHPKPMYKGDQITIYLEDQNQTLYGKLITMPFMGMLDNYTDFRIKSLKSSMIGRDANKLVNGYEVIEEINDSFRTYQVDLVTEISTSLGLGPLHYYAGQKYSDNATDTKIVTVGPGTSTIGNYHVFGTLNYYRVWQDAGISGTPNGIEDTGDLVIFYQTTE